MENIGKPKYGIIEPGLFGVRIVSGIVTGIRYTETKPMYEISMGKNVWWTSEIADNPEDIFKALKLASLERIMETHELKIKFENLNTGK